MKKFLVFLSAMFIGVAFAHTIKWYVDDQIISTTTCDSGDNITPPAPPAKYGYHFKGWNQYILLEYIESTGTQWIDTLVPFNTNSSITCKMDAVFTKKPQDGTEYQNEHMCAVGGNPKVIYMGYFDSNYYIRGDVNTFVRTSIPLSVTSVTTSSNFNKTNMFKINDESYRWVPEEYEVLNNLTLVLFGRRHSSTTVSGLCHARLNKFEITVDGQLVRNFIPVKKINGVVGLYDTVTKTFFENQGTGEFVAGPELGAFLQ